MATQMLNFGGTLKATSVALNNGSTVIPIEGTGDVAFQLNSSRTQGSTVIVFSMVLNNRNEDNQNAKVNIWLANGNSIQAEQLVSVGKDIIVVPGRPISLDYKINLTPTNALYATTDLPGEVDLVVSTVQM